MKKLFSLVLCTCFLVSCQWKPTQAKDTPQDRYLAMASLLENQEILKEKPSNFSLNAELVKNDNQYRYYLILDEPKEAMYNVRVLAMEEGINYQEEMAASAGIFEEKRYHLIPHQYNVEDGFVKGISVSGLSKNKSVVLRVFVRWENASSTEVFRDFYRIVVNLEEHK